MNSSTYFCSWWWRYSVYLCYYTGWTQFSMLHFCLLLWIWYTSLLYEELDLSSQEVCSVFAPSPCSETKALTKLNYNFSLDYFRTRIKDHTKSPCAPFHSWNEWTASCCCLLFFLALCVELPVLLSEPELLLKDIFASQHEYSWWHEVK